MAVDTAAPRGSSSAPTLSFPRDIFAALSPAPFLLAHLAPDASSKPSVRPNGRACAEFRAPAINASSLTHCSGSAVVRLGDTAVVCGVRGEILPASEVPNPPSYDNQKILGPEDGATDAEKEEEAEGDDRAELEQLGLLVPNVELATGATPSLMPGQPPSAQAQALTARLLALLHGTRLVRARDLRVTYLPPRTPEDDEVPDEDDGHRTQVKAFWTLYIDILFISLDGNALDAAWAAVLAALRDTTLPRAWWDPDSEMVLCSDRVEEARRLRLRGRPVAASFGVFEPAKGKRAVGSKNVRVFGLGAESKGGSADDDEEDDRAWVLADPDAFEETNCQETVTVAVDLSSGRSVLHWIDKSGGGVVGRDLLRSVVGLAEKRWQEWSKALDDANASKS